MVNRVYSGAPVPRHYVFVRGDGSYVVQWDDHRVQDILTGAYGSFNPLDFGHPITDGELEMLKDAGRVEHFTRLYVWLYALPEQGRFAVHTDDPPARVRAYYLNTTLGEEKIDAVRSALAQIGDYQATLRSGLIAILSRDATPFSDLKSAENAQRQLTTREPELFAHTVLAFEEIKVHSTSYKSAKLKTSEMVDLSTIIASETDFTPTRDKRAVVVSQSEDDSQPIIDMLTLMRVHVYDVETARDALKLMEDIRPHLLIADLTLSDMHIWEMLSKVREIVSLRNMLTIVIADQGTSPDNYAFGLNVARIDAYLTRPFSMARLRLSIWTAFKNHISDDPRSTSTHPTPQVS